MGGYLFGILEVRLLKGYCSRLRKKAGTPREQATES